MKLNENLPERILLFGKNGQIGWELQRTLAPLGQIIALDKPDLDFTDLMLIREKVREIKPGIIVNAAGYTAVDRAEEEPELAMAVNGYAAGVLAEEAKGAGALLIHYSSDYVFDGTNNRPYTEEDVPHPLNVYGKTKLFSEQAIQAAGGNYLIFRTSWVYGNRGQNFLLTMLRLAREREEIKVVNDQIGAPTWCRMIAESTAAVLAGGIERKAGFFEYFEELKGLYHMTAGGQTSWFGFAQKIFETIPDTERKLKRLVPISTEEYPAAALRPKYSVMDNGKLQKVFDIYTAAVPWFESLKYMQV